MREGHHLPDGTEDQELTADSRGWRAWVWPLLMFLGLLGLYVRFMNPAVTGFLYDDGMYLMAARSLADGTGYRLMDVAGAPWFYKYPPLFPLVLAGVLQIAPPLPEGIPWLKMANITISLLALFVWYRLLAARFPQWAALGLTAMLALHWRYAEVATELMSEPLFFLFGFLVVRQSLSAGTLEQAPDRRSLLLMILFSAAAFYARTIGAILILAVVSWLWWRGERKHAVGYGMGTAIFCVPWLIWSASAPDPTEADGPFLIRSFLESYFQSFRMDLSYEYALPELYGNGVNALAGNLVMYLWPIVSQAPEWLMVMLSLGLVGVLVWAGIQAWRAGRVSLPGLYCLLYFILLPLWGYVSVYHRLVLAVVPFLYLFLADAVQSRAASEPAKRTWLGGFLAFGLLLNAWGFGIMLARTGPDDLYVNADTPMLGEYRSVLEFLRENTPPDAVFYSDNLEERYFYANITGRQALDRFVFLPKAAIPTAETEEAQMRILNQVLAGTAHVTMRMLDRHGVDYLIAHRMQRTHRWELIAKKLPISAVMLEQYPDRLVPVRQSPQGWITVYRVARTSASPAGGL